MNLTAAKIAAQVYVANSLDPPHPEFKLGIWEIISPDVVIFNVEDIQYDLVIVRQLPDRQVQVAHLSVMEYLFFGGTHKFGTDRCMEQLIKAGRPKIY